MELSVANLEIETTIFTWTGMAKRNLVSCLCKFGARVVHKYSKVETSIRMRPLNSLALNEPNRFWSKNPGLCNPRSWAHNRHCCLPLHNFNPCIASDKPNCCQCHRKIASFSLEIHSMVANKESWKISNTVRLWTSLSIFTTTGVQTLGGSWESKGKRLSDWKMYAGMFVGLGSVSAKPEISMRLPLPMPLLFLSTATSGAAARSGARLQATWASGRPSL